jgi:hypothetical protein
MSLKPNMVLENRFQVVSLVMMGGQSIVYKGLDRTTQKAVAIKVMRDIDGVSDEDARRQFTREYEVLREGGPGLPEALGCFDLNGRPVVVEEWVEGRTLDHEGTDLPVERAVKLALGVLEAVEHLHHRTPPVVVRDIKPSNVIVNGDRVWLIDMNSARALRGVKDTVSLGTPGFAAPEQHAGHSEERSDLFSVGALLSFMLCGVDGTLTALPCSPASVRRDISPELDDVIQKATAFDVRARYASAADMAAALRQALRAPAGRGQRLKAGNPGTHAAAAYSAGAPVPPAAVAAGGAAPHGPAWPPKLAPPAPVPAPAAAAHRPAGRAPYHPAPVANQFVFPNGGNSTDLFLTGGLSILFFIDTIEYLANDCGHTVAIDLSGFIVIAAGLCGALLGMMLPRWTRPVPRAITEALWCLILAVGVFGGFGTLGRIGAPANTFNMLMWLFMVSWFLLGWVGMIPAFVIGLIWLGAVSLKPSPTASTSPSRGPKPQTVARPALQPQTLVHRLPALSHAGFGNLDLGKNARPAVYRVGSRYWVIDEASAKAFIVWPWASQPVKLGSNRIDAVGVMGERIYVASDDSVSSWGAQGQAPQHLPLPHGDRLLALGANEAWGLVGLTAKGEVVAWKEANKVTVLGSLPHFGLGRWQMQALGKDGLIFVQRQSGRASALLRSRRMDYPMLKSPALLLPDTLSAGGLILTPHEHFYVGESGSLHACNDEIANPLCAVRRETLGQQVMDVVDAAHTFDYDETHCGYSRAWWYRPLPGRFVAMAVEDRSDAQIGVLSQDEHELTWQRYSATGAYGGTVKMAAEPGHTVLSGVISDDGACVVCADGYYLLTP